MKIGLIGLGNIGCHFANRLLAAGHELVVYDTNSKAQSVAVEKGAIGVRDAAEMSAAVEIILLSLPIPAVVSKVAQEIADAASRKTRLIVDLSTTGPAVTQQIDKLLSGYGITLIGAPVSGGTVAAEHGTLAVMAAGDSAAHQEVLPLLQALGKKLFYLGADSSLGQTIKIINNTLYAASLVASSEALVYGTKAGLDPQTMLDVLNASSGRSFATLERIPQCVLDRSFPIRFTTELLHKDVKMCLDDAERLGVPMLMGPAARQMLSFSIGQGNGAKDNAFVITHFEKWAGVEFGKAPE